MSALVINETVYNIPKTYTYADYASWDTPERFELLDGKAYAMAAPAAAHQEVLLGLALQFGNFFKGKKCRVFIAPFDVCLFGKGDLDKTVVQPDLLVVCDEKKLSDGKRLNGAPDFIIEVLSPGSEKIDLLRKRELYQQAGVREYWIVNPIDKSVLTMLFDGDRYTSTLHETADIICTQTFEGLSIDFNDIFPRQRKPRRRVRKGLIYTHENSRRRK